MADDGSRTYAFSGNGGFFTTIGTGERIMGGTSRWSGSRAGAIQS